VKKHIFVYNPHTKSLSRIDECIVLVIEQSNTMALNAVELYQMTGISDKATTAVMFADEAIAGERIRGFRLED